MTHPSAHVDAPLKTTADERILELFALEAYTQAFQGHTVMRDMDFFVQATGEDCAKAVNHEVNIYGDIKTTDLQSIKVNLA